MNTLGSPKTVDELSQYYQLRWQILRKPWGQKPGSEQDDLEQQAIHKMVINAQGEVLAVGRLEKADNYHGKVRFMAVCEQARGQGLGQQTIKALELQASQLGMKEISLNARAQAATFNASYVVLPKG